MRGLLQWWADRLPARRIDDGEREYLRRYYVGTLCGVRFYLHHFVGDDPDRGLHDHPWGWAGSIILAGAYYEERRAYGTKPRLVLRRWGNWLRGDTFHRVLLPSPNRTCWTLFFHGARCKDWGFLRVHRAWVTGDPLADAQVYQPHVYANESSEEQRWWERAPKGRDLRGKP